MTGDRERPAPGPAPGGPDLLAEVVTFLRRDGALEREELDAFVAGLRARAEKVIAERLERGEAQLRVLEEENQWRKRALTTLEEEKAWLSETVEKLKAEATLRQGEIERAGTEGRKASAAHEALLAHHRELMARLAAQLEETASLSPLRAQEVRRRLRSLVEQLRGETP